MRATTEPLVVITDMPTLMGETGDIEADHGSHNLTLRQRKKVEKMMSAPLPGSQQVTVNVRIKLAKGLGVICK